MYQIVIVVVYNANLLIKTSSVYHTWCSIINVSNVWESTMVLYAMVSPAISIRTITSIRSIQQCDTLNFIIISLRTAHHYPVINAYHALTLAPNRSGWPSSRWLKSLISSLIVRYNMFWGETMYCVAEFHGCYCWKSLLVVTFRMLRSPVLHDHSNDFGIADVIKIA